MFEPWSTKRTKLIIYHLLFILKENHLSWSICLSRPWDWNYDVKYTIEKESSIANKNFMWGFCPVYGTFQKCFASPKQVWSLIKRLGKCCYTWTMNPLLRLLSFARMLRSKFFVDDFKLKSLRVISYFWFERLVEGVVFRLLFILIWLETCAFSFFTKVAFRNGTLSSKLGGTQECSRCGVGAPRWILTDDPFFVTWRHWYEPRHLKITFHIINNVLLTKGNFLGNPLYACLYLWLTEKLKHCLVWGFW